jgi:formylglycine-generating enzyme required for sulfatase activity
MEKVQGTALYYVDRFEWPNQEGVVPEGGVADRGTAIVKCLSVRKRLCLPEELALACSPSGQDYPYGNGYDQTACNSEQPWVAEPSGANGACHAAGSGIFDLSGNLAEWTAVGWLFGGSVKDGQLTTCARLASAEDYADATLLGLRCCLSPTDDLDSDGAQASLDCDDTNDEVKPGAAELCNGLDDDCDGVVDEDLAEDVCNDDNPCTEDLCQPGQGCLNSPKPGDCEAVGPCLAGARCEDGQCKGTPCADLDSTCAGTVCVSNDCSAGETLCDGDFAYLTCKEEGHGWSAAVSCDPGQYCDNGDCKPQVCTPNQPSCLARLAGTCDAKGSALLPGYTDCLTLPETIDCQAGSCIPCPPDCAGKVCGDDGCGGSCGGCGEGGSCVEGTRCTYPGTGGVTWVAIPGGTFQMGCSAGDSNCRSDESPVHQVTLTGFEMLETEITEGQYLAVIGSNPSAHYNGASGPTMPVDSISWSQAKAFCETIGGRIPTEAEWEYAARAGTTTMFYCGNDESCLDGIAWSLANTGNMKQPVKGKTPNAFGLFDMLGNVWEWVSDSPGTYSAEPQTNPQGPDSAIDRIVRGGCFSDPNFYLRVSIRPSISSFTMDPHFGGRCVRSK